ncbi:phosphoribosylformylglycinamidine cyclo-ligase [Pirellulales bacterium]|nr:phosphoribosylformylglycinamidine cyclo-ligase [Pirellulales bacterium]
MSGTTYSSAGVDLALYEKAMEKLPAHMRRTQCPRVMSKDGGFAAIFQLQLQGLFARRYDDPLLISCTDGVGTKLKVACTTGIHHTVGIDLVAMSVNDLLCTGAEPLFFLDYVALSHDDPERLEEIVRGISDACVESDCALVGGETAILPDLYARGDYDLAGFCVGVVERKRLIDGSQIQQGDVAIGIASSGFHSNGYSLIRKVVFDIAGLTKDDVVPECDNKTVAEILLSPTQLYARPIRSVLRHYRVKQVVHGIAHITGGGLEENLARIVPPTIQIQIERTSWEIPAVFRWLQQLGAIEQQEMNRVFNMGIGMVLVVSPHFVDSIQHQLSDMGMTSWKLGAAIAAHEEEDRVVLCK